MEKNSNPSIRISDLVISYPVSRRGKSLMRSISQAATLGGLMTHGAGRRNMDMITALRGVNIEIKVGERVGLIGVNGSGKSTLLTAMAGCITPIRGEVEVNGRLTAFLNLSLGVDQNLSGIENLELRCHYWDIPDGRIKELEEDVIEFTGLGDFLFLPVKSYSSGMRTRLLLALATISSPDILLMDEWIGTSDIAFRESAEKRINKMVTDAGILVLASHSPSILKAWTSRLIWLQQGKLFKQGPTSQILEEFIEFQKLIAKNN